jgi:hypothetical protein
MRARNLVVYPFLMALYPLLALYAQNAYQAPLSDLAWPVALVALAAALVWGAFRVGVSDSAKAGLLTVLAFAVFDTVALAPEWVDGFLEYMRSFWVSQETHVWPPLVVGAELLVAGVLARSVIARLKNTEIWTAHLNRFALILLACPLLVMVQTWAREPIVASGPPEEVGQPPASERIAEVPAAVATAQRSGHRPDIYYIILDGYARSDVMQQLFGFDNVPFLERLQQKGFYIARQSTANYCQTPLSLSSSLNALYLNGLIPSTAHDTSQLGSWIGDGAVVRTLRGLGYRFVTFATGFAQTDHPEADVYLRPSPTLSPFQEMLVSHTPLGWFRPKDRPFDQYGSTRERTLYLFDEVPKIARRDEPTFTFAHILAPHPPFVFGEDGEDVSPHERSYYLTDGERFRGHYGDRDDYTAGYRKQAEFLTKRVERMINDILANSPEPPVIILQSDHGSGIGLDTRSVEATDLHERMSILNAYYMPGAGGAPLYQSISPVNSFRVVLNAYFGAGLNLLPDRSYYSTWDDPFQFIDVTHRVRPTAEAGSGTALQP